MPEKDVTSKTDLQNARSLAKKLKIKYKEINIERGKRLLNLLNSFMTITDHE